MKNIMNKVTACAIIITASASSHLHSMQKMYSLAKTIQKITNAVQSENLRSHINDLPLGTVKRVTNKNILADINAMKNKANVAIDHILHASAIGQEFATIVDKKTILINPHQWCTQSRYHVYAKLAHEIGHVALDHKATMSPQKRHEQEFQADEYATVVFGAGDDLAAYLSSIAQRKKESASEFSFHPLLSERINRILKIHESHKRKPDYLAAQLWKIKFVINSTQRLPHPDSHLLPHWPINQEIDAMSLEDRIKTINYIHEINQYV